MVHQILHEFYLNGVVDIDDTVIYDKYGQFPGKNGSSIGKDGPIQCSSKTQDFFGFCRGFVWAIFWIKRYYDE